MPADERNIETLIKALPKNLREEAIDFIDYLLSKSRSEGLSKRRKVAVPSKNLDPAKDPLLKLIGIADVEPFADRIDEELYGRRSERLH
jgi:hypothetical protein